MTDDLDRDIREALDAEAQALLARMGEEPGFFAQMRRTFFGPGGWAVMVAYAANLVFFVVFALAAWRLFVSTDPLWAIRWAAVAAGALVLTVHFKSVIGQRNEANRILRELRLMHAALLRRNQE